MGKVCVIIGEDDFLVSEAAKKVVGDGTGLEVIDSNTATNEELQLKDLRVAEESYLTPPFFDPRKVTWWKNVRFLPGGGRGAKDGDGEGKVSEAVKEALLKFARTVAKGGLPENQSFILSGPKLLASSVFAKTLATVAEMVVFEKAKGAGAARESAERARARAEELGMRFAPGAAERFVARVGDDTRSLYSELDKMLCYKGASQMVGSSDGRIVGWSDGLMVASSDGQRGAADHPTIRPSDHPTIRPILITAADVDAISSPGAGVEPVLWQVTDALGRRDAKACLAAARAFEGEDGFAVMMTTVVEKYLRQLVELKDAAVRGKLDAATRGMPSWTVRKLEEALRFWTLNELRTARMRFLNLRERCVTSGGGAADAVFIELVRATRRAGGAR